MALLKGAEVGGGGGAKRNFTPLKKAPPPPPSKKERKAERLGLEARAPSRFEIVC